MGNKIKINSISCLYFDAEFIEIFVKLKLFLIMYLENINIEISEFEKIYNVLKSKLEIETQKIDPFNLESLKMFDNYVSNYMNIKEPTKEVPLIERIYASFIIYIRNKIKECVSSINSMQINLSYQILKRLKINLSSILKNLYPVEIHTDVIKEMKKIVIKDIFKKDDEIIFCLKNIETKEKTPDKLNYIVKQLIYINKKVLSTIDFYKIAPVDIKNLYSILNYSLDMILKFLREKNSIETEFSVIIYIPEWNLYILSKILDLISNEKDI